MSHVIRAESLKKRFGETRALDGVDLAARAGTVLGVLGPNGAGKTTAVRVLATLLKPDEGTAEVCGYDVGRNAVEVRQLIGLTGQYASLDEELTGSENLQMVGMLLDLKRSEARARGRELLERFSLTEAAGRAVKTYSGGMRRRLDLAASLMSRPQVIFLDEPTTGLDPRARNQVWETVRGLVSDGTTVLLTTQYLEEADSLADEIVVFDRGQVVAGGTADALKARIGGQTLAVRAVDRSLTPRLATAVFDVTRNKVETDHDTGLVSAPVDDPSVLAALVRRLDADGIVPAELNLRLPSLDEVFLTLTGQAAARKGEEAAGRNESVGQTETEGSLR